jgi:hypothetical protein
MIANLNDIVVEEVTDPNELADARRRQEPGFVPGPQPSTPPTAANTSAFPKETYSSPTARPKSCLKRARLIPTTTVDSRFISPAK